MSNTPSNAEAWDLWLESITGGHHPASLAKFARAVLAKWSTPPAVDGEPIGYLYCGGSYGDELADWEIVADQHQCDKLNEHHGSLGKEARLPLYATPQPTQAQAGAVPLTDDQVIAAWNAQADEYNQWDALGEDEKIEWAVACAKAAPQAVVEPLTDEQVESLLWKYGYDPDDEHMAAMLKEAHGIKGGQP